MISEVDIRDWDKNIKDGYQDFIRSTDGQPPYLIEVWTAAVHWAFQNSMMKPIVTINSKEKE